MLVLLVVACLVVVSTATDYPGSEFRSEPLQCGLHEVPSCVNRCPPERTCRNRGILFSCLNDGLPYTPKCICAEGYYRNAIGECITGEECDRCQKPNEFYSCNSACDNVCENIATQNRTNCPIQNIKCNEWCYCDDGYARDAKKNCVPVNQCPKPAVPVAFPDKRCFGSDTRCGPNEYFTCKLPCPPETCVSLVARFRCDEKQVCRPQCACKPGFLRLREGSPCIRICECPEMAYSADCQKNIRPSYLLTDQQCTGPNEVVTCKTSCPPETCLSLVASFKCDSKEPCKSRCHCKPGYLRVKDDSPCIPTCECPEMANSPDCLK